MLVKVSHARAELLAVFVSESLAKAGGAMCRLPMWCRIGIGSGTLPLVKRVHCIALACREISSFPIGRSGEIRWRIEASEDNAVALSSGSGSTGAGNGSKSNHDA
jgi:hypothetical protein